MADMNGRHGTPSEVRYVEAGGNYVHEHDDFFQSLLKDYERDGVDTDLVYMARPLIDGSPAQLSKARRFLEMVKRQSPDKGAAQMDLMDLLAKQGLGIEFVPHHSAKDLNAVWDEMSGPAQGRGHANFTFEGHRTED